MSCPIYLFFSMKKNKCICSNLSLSEPGIVLMIFSYIILYLHTSPCFQTLSVLSNVFCVFWQLRFKVILKFCSVYHRICVVNTSLWVLIWIYFQNCLVKPNSVFIYMYMKETVLQIHFDTVYQMRSVCAWILHLWKPYLIR